jgi:2-C-methyl-D-erythritol 4-phosphate cytidylyltransferase
MGASIAALITAAGSSLRMKNPGSVGNIKKEYRLLGSAHTDEGGNPLTVLGAAVLAFASCGEIGPIVITVPPEGEGGETAARASLPRPLLAQNRVRFVPGGKTRRESVHRALAFLETLGPEYVLIHDGARPWVSGALIRRILDTVRQYRAVIPILPMAETPKEINRFPGAGETGFIRRHLRRVNVGTAQTPQGFAFPEILQAHEKAALREEAEGFEYTDDAEVWGDFIGSVAVIPGEGENRKITFPEDL